MENVAYSSYLHLGSGIVAALRQYGPMSVAFLAKTLRRRPDELESYLRPLQEQGVISRDGETVSIVAETD